MVLSKTKNTNDVQSLMDHIDSIYTQGDAFLTIDLIEKNMCFFEAANPIIKSRVKCIYAKALMSFACYQQALDAINEAIHEGTENSEIFFLRAMAFKSLKKLESSIQDLNTAISLSPNNGAYFYELAEIEMLSGNKIFAMKYFFKSAFLGFKVKKSIDQIVKHYKAQ